jgi:hypothetical protein
MSKELAVPIGAVEVQEFLFSESLAKVAGNCEREKHNVTDWSALQQQVRETFRLHRFAVTSWLMMNGVSIPAHLLADQAHPPVGEQYPDKQREPIAAIKGG